MIYVLLYSNSNTPIRIYLLLSVYRIRLKCARHTIPVALYATSIDSKINAAVVRKSGFCMHFALSGSYCNVQTHFVAVGKQLRIIMAAHVRKMTTYFRARYGTMQMRFAQFN